MDEARLGAELRVEPSPATGDLYPHLYQAMPTDAVIAIHPLGRDDRGDYTFEPGASR